MIREQLADTLTTLARHVAARQGDEPAERRD